MLAGGKACKVVEVPANSKETAGISSSATGMEPVMSSQCSTRIQSGAVLATATSETATENRWADGYEESNVLLKQVDVFASVTRRPKWAGRSGAFLVLALLVLAGLGFSTGCAGAPDGGPGIAGGKTVEVSFPSSLTEGPVQGRLLLFLARPDESVSAEAPEPRFQTSFNLSGIPVFGIDVNEWSADSPAVFDASVFGYPLRSLADVEPGEYVVQALLHHYEDFTLSNGKQVQLPMDRGEGQQWARAPGNLFSTPQRVTIGSDDQVIRIELDQVIAPIDPPADSEFVRHIKLRSELLSEFWGRDMFLGAHVLVPRGFDQHPEARYPLMVFHGHHPADFGGFRTEPPDPDLECQDSARFGVACYNRIVQQEAFDFYRRWISDDFPRFLIIEIQHANPYYDDSYAVNSANIGPYGDAIMHELIPEIERSFRGIGRGWARFTYGGSTGGWEALAAQVFYPDDFNGAFAACPDPIDFRAYMTVNLYEDSNAFTYDAPFKRQPRPAWRNTLGQVHASVRDLNDLERVLGEHGRSGDQLHIWQAVYSPMGDDGYPQPIWDEETGEIDKDVADSWRENYDLRHILQRDWSVLGPKLAGKIHIYCGDMDNYYLNNAVYLMEDFLESTTSPYYAGEVDYGDRAEHCWNGDHENGNHISRLRYNTFYLPKILDRIRTSAPRGADLTSWRY